MAVTAAEPLTAPTAAGTATAVLVSKIICVLTPLTVVVVATWVNAGTVIIEAVEF